VNVQRVVAALATACLSAACLSAACLVGGPGPSQPSGADHDHDDGVGADHDDVVDAAYLDAAYVDAHDDVGPLARPVARLSHLGGRGQRALDWRQTMTQGVDSYTQVTQAGRLDGTSSITVHAGKITLKLDWTLIGKTVYFKGNINALSGHSALQRRPRNRRPGSGSPPPPAPVLFFRTCPLTSQSRRPLRS